MGRKVAFFLPTLGGGGAEKCMMNLARGLSERGLDVSIVLVREEGPFAQPASNSFRLLNLKSRTVRGSIPGVAQYLRRERPDILVCALEPANVAGLIAKHVARIDLRVVVTVHTMVSMMSKGKSGVAGRLMPTFMRLLYPTADAVVAVSEAVAADVSKVARLPGQSIRVIYNPVAIREVLNLSRQPLSSPWLEQGASPMVIAVGNLWPYKDHALLIHALSIARRDRPLRLVILGEGPERSRLTHLTKELGLEEDVLMPGFVENPYSWMGRSAVLALPSRWEGLPTVLVEALACGITPGATDCPGGSAEVLEKGKYGYLTPVGDAGLMAAALLKSLDNPLVPQHLQERAEAFSVDKAVEGYLKIFSSHA
jgi:glycosyltransferase involved in cell wall biosynthesis